MTAAAGAAPGPSDDETRTIICEAARHEFAATGFAACAGATMLPEGWAASTIDDTLKLLAPAVGEKLVARGRVPRSGRTLSVAAADVFSVKNGKETFCATALTAIRNFESSGRRDQLRIAIRNGACIDDVQNSV